LITINHLRKRFSKGGWGRDFELHIDFLSVQRNEVVYFVGPNGSGKTVLLALIQGLIEPDSGSILIRTDNSPRDLDLLQLKPFERAQFLGVVPQDSDEALIDEMTIMDHVLVGLGKTDRLPWFFPKTRNTQLAQSLLKQFSLGLESRLSEFVGNLSGGERQVLAFCLASVGRPALLLLDEFTSALDPEMAHKVLKLAVSVIKDNKLSAIIVTHRHSEALNHADRIIVLHRGKPFKELRRGESEFNEDSLGGIFNKLYGST
jgi:putative ABC transport system ATP-binding protein